MLRALRALFRFRSVEEAQAARAQVTEDILRANRKAAGGKTDPPLVDT